MSQLVLKITCETCLLKCHIFSSFQSLLAGGSFPLAMLLMTVTNVASVFTVPPMLVWFTDLNSGVNLSRFGILMLVFCLVTLLPTIVSSTENLPRSFLELTHITLRHPGSGFAQLSKTAHWNLSFLVLFLFVFPLWALLPHTFVSRAEWIAQLFQKQ